jgi:hypothetical protein
MDKSSGLSPFDVEFAMEVFGVMVADDGDGNRSD